MVQARLEDREIVIDILANSFRDNRSVNYIIKQDGKRTYRIRKLMEYAFDVCFLFGSIILSEDKKGCALVLWPHRKKMSIRTIFLDVRLILHCSGIGNVLKVLKREARIKALHPKLQYKHLWFIGVHPDDQNKGIGTDILKYVTNDETPVFLETSTLINLPWYKKNGFEVYSELDLGYTLYLLKKSK